MFSMSTFSKYNVRFVLFNGFLTMAEYQLEVAKCSLIGFIDKKIFYSDFKYFHGTIEFEIFTKVRNKGKKYSKSSHMTIDTGMKVVTTHDTNVHRM